MFPDVNEIELSAVLIINKICKYTFDAINSILNQTYKNFELIIIDSSNDTNFYIWLKQYVKTNIKIIYLKDSSGKSTANHIKEAFSIANGKYVVINSIYDISDKFRYEKQIEYIKRNKNIAILGTFVEFKKSLMRKNLFINKIYKQEDLEFWLNFFNPIYFPSILINNKLLKENDIIIQSSLPYSYDYYLLYEVISRKLKVEKIPEYLVKSNLRIKEISNCTKANKLTQLANNEIKYGLLKRFFENNDVLYQIINLFEEYPIGKYNDKRVRSGLKLMMEANKKLNLFQSEIIENILTHPILPH